LIGKLGQALLVILAIAVVARVVFGLLGPVLPVIVVLLVAGAILTRVLRGPRGGDGPFHR
jgi:hypothetical protein